ncbi:hypothetical protein E8E15_007390 [Penicillium rubens]|uniref:uncharacterized protein n=1 Tax=Penicillium rubens TaxID=1108849 RepID=UPI001DFFCC37|nr:uncharacterized protein N7525_008797 [Penicillium rubens]KAF3023333.1 hypothetical protein E8E15_007390 [Penicillium rubens]KAJ5048070.1 protein that induces appearance of [PIN+] prion when overproduced [Penicillium rubens]KAJ5830544.1 hypothetical protein N7525_008797 [Penicillium rubens]KAJ5854125.1 hypothetical protein N7534_006668 [Penicillium rubens]
MAASSEFASAMTTRSLRMVRTELEFLADASVITPQQLSSILSQLPTDSETSRAVHTSPSPPRQQAQPAPAQHVPVQAQPPPAPYTPSYSPPVSQMNNVSINEKAFMHNQHVPVQAQPPQAPPAYPQVPPVLGLASAMYAYTPTDAGDLALQPQDRIQIIEHMNDDWWRGRNERTGQEGIFPRSYVNVVNEKAGISSPPPTNYGNMPLAVSQSGQPEDPNDPKKNKFEEGGKKFGKKLGNAAIFGAGATVGSNIVNSIF